MIFKRAARNDTLLFGVYTLGLDLRIGELGIAFGLRIEVGGEGRGSCTMIGLGAGRGAGCITLIGFYGPIFTIGFGAGITTLIGFCGPIFTIGLGWKSFFG